ncbi:hypothetical protein ACAG24_024785 [Mycobacterium sp. pW049]|uniref:hypothetical protein n=1 Tax=[Mycobacterium] bulgaricum TaxID=3238985 RepID=UPI00351AE4F4
MGGTASVLALLDAHADSVGSRIAWELRVRVSGGPECVGLTAGAGHVLIYGPVCLDGRAVTHINARLDALLRRERRIVEDHNSRPRLI